MGLLKILNRRYFVYDDLSSFSISGQNWKRKGRMVSSMIKGPRLQNAVFDLYGNVMK